MNVDLVAHQKYVEMTHSKKHINKKILIDLKADKDFLDCIDTCIELVEEWLKGTYYQSKQDRLAELAKRDIRKVVEQIMVVVVQVDRPTLFTAVVGEITGALKMSNKIDGTKTAAELLAVMCESNVYDIWKDDKYESMQMISNYELENHTKQFIERTKYLPPMVVEPLEVSKNFDLNYLTQASSMILGKGNHHDGDICLDSLNKFNQVPLSLNKRLLVQLSETPKKDFEDVDQERQWNTFVKDSYAVYRDLIQLGNKCWLTHKVDKRGRTYAQGYHVSTQGNQFRKAIVEFADKEVIKL